MSLHSHIQRPGADHITHDACSCGWVDVSGAPALGDKYREHVETVLGADAFLPLAVACVNCGSRHTQPCLIGLAVSYGHCAACGCGCLRPDNAVYHAAHEDLSA